MSFNWVNQLKADAQKLVDYTREVEARLNTAQRELSNLAAGLLDSDVADIHSWDTSTKIKVTAARGLERLSKMPHSKKPYSNYF